MDIKQVFLSFDGRMNRQPFWVYGVLVLGLVNFVGSLILGMVEGGSGILALLWSLALIWPGIAVSVKRCHDRNKSGWFLLIGLIPVVGAFWLLIELGFLRGTKGPNRFGPDPLAAFSAGAYDGSASDWSSHSLGHTSSDDGFATASSSD